MTDHGITTAASLITLGLILNGCMSSTPLSRITEHDIVDEREIAKGLAEAGCYASGREWSLGACRPARHTGGAE